MDTSKTIKQNELKKGDILLFSVIHGDWESELIALLTDAPVSHTAMVYDETHIIEETPPSAAINDLSERIKNRDIYVMRLKNVNDLSSTIEIADKYAKANWPYADNALPFIGLYMIGKKYIFTGNKQKIYNKILECALAALIDINNKKKYGDKAPMMCSQFAYHCYKESGHKININNNVDETILSKMREYFNSNKKDLLQEPSPKDELNYVIPDKNTLNKLVQELREEIKNNDKAANEALSDNLMLTAYRFSSCFVDTFGKNKDNGIVDIFDKLEELYEYFVSPGDLLLHTTNLEFKGILAQ